MIRFLRDLQKTNPVLHKLTETGLKRLQYSDYHGPPFTIQVDAANGIYEMRIGRRDITRAFFFFRSGREIVVTNGYVKKSQSVDTNELERARAYKRDWEARYQ